jgi:serine/threonine-protein kinase
VISTVQPTSLKPGDVLVARYHVDQRIARGAVADVFRARDARGDRSVAIKVLRGAADPAGVEYRRFQREALLLEQLDHPNVARTLDHGISEQGAPFIVLELVQGPNLATQLADRGAAGLPATFHVTRQVLLALQTAHALGIIHRDIKPQNILLGEGWQVKLVDFGLAKTFGPLWQAARLTEQGMAVGTPRYMAPEQVRGLEVDGRVDLYPLGLVMAEMLSGQPLVAGERAAEILPRHVSPQPHVLPQAVTKSPLAAVVARAVAKAPEQRYRSAAEMRAALEAAAAGPR